MRGWMVSCLWLLLAAPAVGIAQDEDAPPAAADNGEQQTEDKIEAPEPVSGEDVWAVGADDEEEVFVPSETVSADSAIAFPADI